MSLHSVHQSPSRASRATGHLRSRRWVIAALYARCCRARRMYLGLPAHACLVQFWWRSLTNAQSRVVPDDTGPGRTKIRNELIFQAYGGSDVRPEPLYRLEVAIRERSGASLVAADGDAVAQTYNIDATFQLIRLTDNKAVLRGTSYWARSPSSASTPSTPMSAPSATHRIGPPRPSRPTSRRGSKPTLPAKPNSGLSGDPRHQLWATGMTTLAFRCMPR